MKGINDTVFNLELLTKNRDKNQIYLMSSSTTSLVAASINGFYILPVVNSLSSFNFELSLCERYLVNNRKRYNRGIDHVKCFAFLYPDCFKIEESKEENSNLRQYVLSSKDIKNLSFNQGSPRFNDSNEAPSNLDSSSERDRQSNKS